MFQNEQIHSLGQYTEAVAETRGQAAAALVGLMVAFFGTLGKKEPIMILAGSVMAGIGAAGLISGVVKANSSK